MDFLRPHPHARRSPPVKSKCKNRTSKLSLKNRTKAETDFKENKVQNLQLKSKVFHTPQFTELDSQKDLFSSLISSDESDSEDKQFLTDSAVLHDSQLSVPKAESTRIESNRHCANEDTNRASFFSCKSKVTPSSSDSEEQDGVCEESIIYISDEESLLTQKRNSPKIVIPESTDSSSDGKTKNKNKTVILESSSEDDSVAVIRKHFIGKTVLSALNNLSKSAPDVQKDIVLPPSTSCSDSANEIIDSSVQLNPVKIKDSKETSSPFVSEKSKTLGERIVIPDSTEEEISEEESEEISPRTLAAEKLSQTKVDDIHRWLDRNNVSGSECSETEGKNRKSTAVRENSKKSSPTSVQENSKKSSPSSVCENSKKYESATSTDESFDGLRNRYRRLPKKTLAKSSVKSSFLCSDSSDSTNSVTDYRKLITKNLKKDVENIERTPFTVIRKTTDEPRRAENLLPKFRLDSSSEILSDSESSSSSEWDPDFGRNKKPVKLVKPVKTTKPQRKPPVPVNRIVESDFQTPKPVNKGSNLETPRTLKGSNFETPRTLKKPVKDKETPSVKPKTDSAKRGKVDELKKPGTPYSPIRTFLTSLSGPAKDPSLRNHPEASTYFKNYKSKREELAKRLFKLYNREVFDSRLPHELEIKWNARLVSAAGYCRCRMIRKPDGTTRTATIELSTKILDSADRLRDTLIHELCHAAVWLLNNVSGGHGPFWKAWAQKAEKRFPELPQIARCHDYKIETKFTYKCTKCGYSFGRHSKSINLQTQRCGKCYGTFEVLVNKQGRTQNGSLVATPATPKPPSGFALFVKENYGSVKKVHSDKKHGDIMKLLGQKFAEVKLNQGSQ